MPVHYPSEFALDKASDRYYSYIDLVRSKWCLRDRRIRSGCAVIVYKDVQFQLADNARVMIGDHSIFSSYAFLLLTKPNPVLEIGNYVGIGRHTQISVKKTVVIGDFTRIGSFVTIRDNIHKPFKNKDEKIIQTQAHIEPVKIGKDVWIGNYATIMPGVNIGDGAIISTYALVSKDVPPYTLVAGQPARVIKMRYE